MSWETHLIVNMKKKNLHEAGLCTMGNGGSCLMCLAYEVIVDGCGLHTHLSTH